MEFGRESGLLESRRVESVARYPTPPHSSGEAPHTGSGRTQLVEILRSEPGELPRNGDRPPPASLEGEGKALRGSRRSISPEEGAGGRGAEGRCLLPSLPSAQGQNPFPLEHLLFTARGR